MGGLEATTEKQTGLFKGIWLDRIKLMRVYIERYGAEGEAVSWSTDLGNI